MGREKDRIDWIQEQLDAMKRPEEEVKPAPAPTEEGVKPAPTATRDTQGFLPIPGLEDMPGGDLPHAREYDNIPPEVGGLVTGRSGRELVAPLNPDGIDVDMKETNRLLVAILGSNEKIGRNTSDMVIS